MFDDSEYDLSELIPFVGQVLQDMDPYLADVLVRHVVDQKTVEAIAEELGVPVDIVEQRLFEATRSFQGKIARAMRGIAPLRRRVLMLLPFGLGALLPPVEPMPPEFVQEVVRDVWQRLARELGFSEELPPALRSLGASCPEPPASGVRVIRAGNEPPPPSSRRLRDAARPFVERVFREAVF